MPTNAKVASYFKDKLSVSIRRRKRFGFYQLHIFITACRMTFSCFCTESFGTAFLTFISFSQLDHLSSPTCYLVSIGSPQQLSRPLPPLVTTNSLPHFLQVYFFPTSFAIFNTPYLFCWLFIFISKFFFKYFPHGIAWKAFHKKHLPGPFEPGQP